MKEPMVFIEHILESIKNIESHTKGYNLEKFLRSQKNKRCGHQKYRNSGRGR